MHHHPFAPASPGCSRRQALRLLSAGLGTLATGCTPIRVLLNDAPAPFHDDDAVAEPVLRAFVATVVPGVTADRPGAARVFFDSYYPLAAHRAWLAADLVTRARRRFHRSFIQLAEPQRADIIASGLNAGGVTARVYTGAVFLAQIAVYGGLVEADGSCPVIGFAGPAGLVPPAQQSYPDPARFLPDARTRTGHPD